MQRLILQSLFNLFLILIFSNLTALLSLHLLVLFELLFTLFSLLTLQLIILIEFLQTSFQMFSHQPVLRALILSVLLPLLKQVLPRSINLLLQVLPASLLLLVYSDCFALSPLYLRGTLDLALIGLLSVFEPRLLYLVHLIDAVKPLFVLPLEHSLN